MNFDYPFSGDESSISDDNQEVKQTLDQIEIMDDLDGLFIQQENQQEEEQQYNIPQDEQYQNTDFEIRDYQIDLFQKSKEKNSIIFLETGRGKTHIALMHIYYYIKKNGFQNTKLVFLANTIQLVEQQCQLIRDQIYSVAQEMEKKGLAPQDYHFDLQLFKDNSFKRKFIVPIHSKSILGIDEGMDIQGWKKERWDDIINESCVLVMMGQMLLNALRRGYLKLPYFSLIIFDECHHCTQRHSYRLIIKEFLECEKVKKQIQHSEKVKFLGLTATPVTSVDIERAVKISSVPSLQIEVDILQLALNLQSKYVQAQEKQIKEYQSKVITYNQDLGISTTYTPKHQTLNDFFRLWQEIYFEKEKDKISYSIQLLIDQLYHFVTMYGIILYKDLGAFSFYQFIKQLFINFEEIKFKYKVEKDQKLLDKIKKLFHDYLEILQPLNVLNDENLSNKFIALRNQLLEITQNNKENKKLLIFVDQKITAKYLHQLLELHQLESTYVVGTGNLTSGALQMTILKDRNKFISLSPNINALEIAEKIYEQFNIEGKEEDIELNNEDDDDNQTKMKLRSQLQEVLEGVKNYGKKLDQTITTSNAQKESIKKFKESCNILVSTNVTEEGFDVPNCHYVFIFGEITTLKQFIQKIGRARAEGSVFYFILPKEKELMWMAKEKVLFKTKECVERKIEELNKNNYYSDLKNRINSLNKQINNIPKFKEEYYDCRLVKDSLALVNVNWAVEILSNYANIFKNFEYRGKDENYIRGIFYQYTEFPSLGWKCVLILPKNFSDRYFIGDLMKTKEDAKRSAAFKAVLILKQKQMLTEDLRPVKSAYHFVSDRKNDPNLKDPNYCQVIQESVVMKVEPLVDLRQKLFPYKMDVFEISIQQPLYLYKFKFFELPPLIKIEKGKEQAIGFLHNSQFCNRFKFQGGKEIRLEFVKKITITLEQYNLLNQVHQFLVATSFDWDLPFYSFLAKETISSESALFQQGKKQQFNTIDDQKQYALLVLLLGDQEFEEFNINYEASANIVKYIEKMKKVFSFLNSIKQKKKMNQQIKEERQRLNDMSIRFETWNSLEYDGDLIKLLKESNFKGIVGQNITDRYFFSKVVFDSKRQIEEQIQRFDNEKKKEFLKDLQNVQRSLKLVINFNFDNEKDLYAAPILRKYLKQHINQNREIITKNSQKDPKYQYFSGEFYQFPLNISATLELRILTKHILQQLRDFLVSYTFKSQTSKLLDSGKQDLNSFQPQTYQVMDNIMIQDSQEVINFFADNSSEFQDLLNQFNQNIDLNVGNKIQDYQKQLKQRNFKYSIHDIDNELLHKCFQSQQFNQDDQTNYQVLEFLGDANLKLLSSIEVFVQFPFANEHLLHLERARIVSNENLRKFSIIHRFFNCIKCTNFDYSPPEFLLDKNTQELSEIQPEKQKENKENTKYQYTQNGEVITELPKNYQPIPEKVHSDVVEALNGAFLIQYDEDINACQFFLHRIGVLKYPLAQVKLKNSTTLQAKGLLQKNLNSLENIIGYKFNDQSILIQAITHQSFLSVLDFYNYRKCKCNFVEFQNTKNILQISNLNQNDINESLLTQLNQQQNRIDMSYERLEFLGDSVLDSVVVEWLVKEFNKEKVEDLALKKQCVVCNKALALVTLHYKLDQFLLHPTLHKVAHENHQTLNKIKQMYNEYYDDISKMYTSEPIIKILGDVFESIVGAIFVDSSFNYDLTKQVVFKLLMPFMQHFTSPNQIIKNPQDRLFRYFKGKNQAEFEIVMTDEDPVDGQNLYHLRDKNTYAVHKKIRATSEKQAREKLLEFIQRRGDLE
ncbi:unnamed protein product (macronuclear) [Paramecium tetraurelia]|uniref:Chromosome undetermined scaffold_70, whole genome shotgun sequence n=1 Tax=Paramecium tetraurelia TaxID=5888 RepID=Q3SD86_PARTE|nr:uncharacterized protein GSPATT00021751001 [Paramecium tetraurelia]CAI44479.1 Dicer-like ribonuclease with helicase and Rnase III domains [Paramecium tetraurelia]CAK88583.1 unnamed protein product [Paramecium tetraurelia]|eukprot:XP_001455980.1 hypothetical protein (macronuclear) [Paramecium tetraurelia strain d4-2]